MGGILCQVVVVHRIVRMVAQDKTGMLNTFCLEKTSPILVLMDACIAARTQANHT